MNIVIVTLDHQSTCRVPDDVVVHGAISSFAGLTDRCIKASTVLDDVVNPIVGNFSTRCFALHDLDNGTVRLQITDIPHFVVEDLGCVTDGKHRGSTGQVDGVVREVHVSAPLVNRDHQSFLVRCGPIDGVEVGIVHRVVVRLTRRTLEFDGTTVGVGDGDVVNKGVL